MFLFQQCHRCFLLAKHVLCTYIGTYAQISTYFGPFQLLYKPSLWVPSLSSAAKSIMDAAAMESGWRQRRFWRPLSAARPVWSSHWWHCVESCMKRILWVDVMWVMFLWWQDLDEIHVVKVSWSHFCLRSWQQFVVDPGPELTAKAFADRLATGAVVEEPHLKQHRSHVVQRAYAGFGFSWRVGWYGWCYLIWLAWYLACIIRLWLVVGERSELETIQKLDKAWQKATILWSMTYISNLWV